jgi:hypothetical protein
MGAQDDHALRRLLDVEEIRHLKARYFRLLDAKDWSAWTEVFTPDLRFVYADPSVQHVPPDADVLPGGGAEVDRDRLVAFVSQAMRHVTTVHHGHMPEITLTGPDRAEGHWTLTNDCEITRPDGSHAWIRGYGHYDDEYVRTDAGWRISHSIFYRRDMDTTDGLVRPPT